MPRRTLKRKKSFFRKVHLQALLFLILYSIISKSLFVNSIVSSSPAKAFFVPYFFGIIAGIVFLYLFNHEDFFHFIGEVEKIEKNKEKKFLNKYKHLGKLLSTLVIATVGGPIFSALTIRFLLNTYKFKYVLIILGNIPSTVIHVLLAKGVLFAIFS